VRITEAPLPGVLVIEATRFRDARGWLAELWNADRYRAAGFDATFVQANISASPRGVLRGMHYQYPHPQGKLITVVSGTTWEVAVDVRAASPTFGRWYGHELSGSNGVQLWVPEGFARGFLVLSDEAVVHYSCTAIHDPSADRTLAWDDPDVGIEWPERPAVLSEKDRAAPRLRDIPPAALPTTGITPRNHT
jgi:dTDP-4-dehydrorhamnose 3,5-epimerase